MREVIINISRGKGFNALAWMKLYQHVQFHNHWYEGEYEIMKNYNNIIALYLLPYTISFRHFFENNSPFAYSSLKYHQISNEVHSESENPNFQMYRIDAE